jgi:hypothetical protein
LTSAVVEAADSENVARVKRRNASVYVVREPLIETPWYGLYRARKIFRNARNDGLELEEADEAEWLDVLLKTIHYTRVDSREYVKTRRDQVWFEAKKVLGCGDTNLLPEPLDYLEVTNAHDSFTFARSGTINHKEPVLVFENIAGQPLAKWQITERPILPRVLRVLAEVLEFLSVLHEQGFVATALGPAALWIDATDRVYHMASDCVVSASAVRTISADRFPQGFSPPEAFDPSGKLDASSDLYSWATLAYFLIAGESPAQIAASQGERHATLLPEQRAKLADHLGQLDPAEIAALGNRLGVTGKRFARHFPESLVGAIASCWNAARTDRPGSIDELRTWFAKAPPPKVRGALAIRSAQGSIEILLLTAGLDRRMELVIRRFTGKSIGGTADGVQVYAGAIKDRINDATNASGQPLYGVFCRDTEDGQTSYSGATEALFIDLRSPSSLLGILATLAQSSVMPSNLFDDLALPEIVSLIQLHSSIVAIARQMFDSSEPLVRRWAVKVLADVYVRSSLEEAQDAAAGLWDRGLRDSNFDIRLATARVILRASADPGVSTLDRIAKILGGPDLDDRRRALRSLQRCGVSSNAIQAAVRALEADRIVSCKVCSQQLRAGEMDAHLRRVHDFVELDAQLLPRALAVAQLWPRLLLQHDTGAASSLAALLISSDQSVEVLQSQLVHQCQTVWLPAYNRAAPPERSLARERFVNCLRVNPYLLRATWHLISADEPALRELGRDALLPTVAGRLADDSVPVATYRQFVEALTRREDLDCKIATCQSLAKSGASLLVARRATQEFGLDRETVCADCRAMVRRRDVARHERTVHGRYVFEGQAWQWEQLTRHLGLMLLSGNPTLETAQLCSEILEERVGVAEWAQRYVAVLSSAAMTLPADRERLEFLDLAASVLAQLDRAYQLVGVLLVTNDTDTQELALAMLATGAVPVIESLVEAALPVFERAEIDERFRASAVRELLSSLSQGMGERLLRAFVKPLPDKLVGIERLRELQAAIGNLPAIASVWLELEASMRIQCPLCRAVMSGSEMRSHAQQVHRMVWEGRRLRQPWSIAEDCLEQFAQDGKYEWLESGEHYAMLSGDEGHRLAFMREALKRGLARERYLPYFEAAAGKVQSTLCGDCYRWIPSPRSLPLTPVHLSVDSLTSEYIEIKNTQSLLQSEPEISLRGGNWVGKQPDGHFSRQGVFILHGALFGMLLLAVIVLAALNPAAWLVFVAGWIGLALLSGAAAALYKPRHSSPLAVAWEIVVPELTKGNPETSKLAFIAGLARVSEGIIDRGRQRRIEAAARAYQSWYESGAITYAPLAQILRLLLVDQLRNQGSGANAAHTLTTYLHQWSLRRWPADALDMMTGGGEVYVRLPTEQQRLLRWRWLRCCHDAGFSPQAVLALAGAGDLFRNMLTAQEKLDADIVSLAFAILELPSERLHRLDGESVFHWAAQNNPINFRTHPPRVLVVSTSGDLTIRADGLYFRDLPLDAAPKIDMRTLAQFVQTGWTHQRVDGQPDQRFKHNPPIGYQRIVGYDLVVGGHSFPFGSDPTPVIYQIRAWISVYNNEIVPRAKALASANAPQRRYERGALVRCPDCGKTQAFVEGKVAIAC